LSSLEETRLDNGSGSAGVPLSLKMGTDYVQTTGTVQHGTGMISVPLGGYALVRYSANATPQLTFRRLQSPRNDVTFTRNI
jgi:hypothetical protein